MSESELLVALLALFVANCVVLALRWAWSEQPGRVTLGVAVIAGLVALTMVAACTPVMVRGAGEGSQWEQRAKAQW